ncbi:MAG TPA: efflux RND transporter periplasmic adaptor subunit [Polyangiaceae bacterium]|jgi:RND family efflux transporter MFP subunit
MNPSNEHADFDPAAHHPSPRRLFLTGLGAVLLAVALGASGAIPRALQKTAAAKEEQAAASLVPRVMVGRAQRATSEAPLTLPGSVQPLQETAIFARANGYVRAWHADIGATVKKGQVLAELDIPDLDDEFRQATAAAHQAEASVTQAKSELDFARATNDRFTALIPTGVVSQQQTDQYASAYDVRAANLEAARAAHGSAQANVRRVQDLRAYGTLVAPFDGVVTLRGAEVGQLVVAGTGQGQPLFKVAEDDVVRVFVNVPQLYAAGIQPGQDAPVTIREAAGRVFHGRVARTSRELDTASRSLLTEVDIPNADRALVAGMYARVSFDVKRQDAPLFVPATAVLIDAKGARVAVVKNGEVRWQTIEIGADLGDRVAVPSGLSEGDSVVLTPSARLREGQRVQPQTAS